MATPVTPEQPTKIAKWLFLIMAQVFGLEIPRTMRKAAVALMGAMLLTSSCAQAVTLAAPTGLNAAAAQKVLYVCRQGSNRRECYYVSPSPRQPNANEDTPYFQKRYTGPSQYQLHPWGSPYGAD